MEGTMEAAAVRDEAAIQKDLLEALSAYQVAVELEPRRVVDELSSRVKALKAEMSAFLSAGADLCPACSAQYVADLKTHEERVAAGQSSTPPALPPAVMGMLKRPAHVHRGEPRPALYEVGCVVHDVIVVGEPKRLMRARARGETAAVAVRRWNQGAWIEPAPAAPLTVES